MTRQHIPHYAADGRVKPGNALRPEQSLVCNIQELWGRMRGRSSWLTHTHSLCLVWLAGLAAVVPPGSSGHLATIGVGQNAADRGPSDSTSPRHQEPQHHTRMEQCSEPSSCLASQSRVHAVHRKDQQQPSGYACALVYAAREMRQVAALLCGYLHLRLCDIM